MFNGSYHSNSWKIPGKRGIWKVRFDQLPERKPCSITFVWWIGHFQTVGSDFLSLQSVVSNVISLKSDLREFAS